MLFDIQMMINLTQIVNDHNPKLSLLFFLKQLLAQQHHVINKTKTLNTYLWDLPWFSFDVTFCLARSSRLNDLSHLHLMVLFLLSALFTLSPILSGVNVYTHQIHCMQYHTICLHKLPFNYQMHNTHTFDVFSCCNRALTMVGYYMDK